LKENTNMKSLRIADVGSFGCKVNLLVAFMAGALLTATSPIFAQEGNGGGLLTITAPANGTTNCPTFGCSATDADPNSVNWADAQAGVSINGNSLQYIGSDPNGNTYWTNAITLLLGAATLVAVDYDNNTSAPINVTVDNQITNPRASGTAALSVYFLVQGVGFRWYTHNFYENYTKQPCAAGGPLWILTDSSATVNFSTDPIVWGDDHIYSFQTAWTPMGAAAGGQLLPAGTAMLELPENPAINVTAAPTGSDSITGITYTGTAGTTPGLIIVGTSISVGMP
jgi:hypothetical protein